MTEQRKKVNESKAALEKYLPADFKPAVAIITNSGYKVPNYFKIFGKKTLNTFSADVNVVAGGNNSLLFSRYENKDYLIINGRFHYYEGYTMRDLAHYIYILKTIGIRRIIAIDEVSNLNPRFHPGETVLIYDHINLTGDNPLIGENDEYFGIRFPDMSDAYSEELFQKVYKVIQNLKYKINESVYLGVIGPESETEAEARFYREIGADVVGYSLIPENIASVHCRIKFLAIGLITRDIIADKMAEDTSSLKKKLNLKEKNFRAAKLKCDIILKNILESDF